MTRLGSPSLIKLTYGRRLGTAAPISRLRRARAQEDETSLSVGISSQRANRGSPPGSARADQALGMGVSVWSRHAVFMTAPSMTTPAVTYFHSATSSFLARATSVVFLSRP